MWLKLKNWWYRRPMWLRISIITFVLLLVLTRILAPIWIKHNVLQKLSEIEGFEADMDYVDISLFNASLSFVNLRIYSKKTGDTYPFFSAQKVEGKPRWNDLLNGEYFTNVTVRKPVLRFIAQVESRVDSVNDTFNNFENVAKINWREELRQIFAFTINTLTVHKGEIHYHEPDLPIPIHIKMSDISAEFKNLANRDMKEEQLYGTGYLEGIVNNHAKFSLETNLDPLHESGCYEIKSAIEPLNLASFNAVLEKHARLDVEEGKLSLNFELKSDSGRLDGMIYPKIYGLNVLDLKKEKRKKLLNKTWQGIVGLAVRLISHEKDEEIHTRISVDGTFKDLHFTLIKNDHILLSKLLVKLIGYKTGYEIDFKKPK